MGDCENLASARDYEIMDPADSKVHVEVCNSGDQVGEDAGLACMVAEFTYYVT